MNGFLKKSFVLSGIAFLIQNSLWAAEAVSKSSPIESMGLAIGAGLAIGISALGAGIAIGNVGSSSIGAVVEKPDFFAKALVFLGLGEALAIYGLVIAILLMSKI